MLLYPNAKINLGLRITSHRTDGYHNIETIFYPLGLTDILEITLPPEQSQECIWQSTGLTLDCTPHDNLCLRALRALRQIRQLPTIGLHLHKIIPTGAGLGGGSADAAFLIRHLNTMLQLQLSDNQLHNIAAHLGADCPYFLLNTPAIARGIGDQLTPIDLNLRGKYIYLVKPPIHISTRQAYAGISPHQPETDLRDILSLPIQQWKDQLVNDFEPVAFTAYPQLAQIKQTLYDHGALYASMTGSGSAIYGIFDHQPTLPKYPQSFTYQGTLQY